MGRERQDRQADRQAESQTDRQTETETERERERDEIKKGESNAWPLDVREGGGLTSFVRGQAAAVKTLCSGGLGLLGVGTKLSAACL